MTEYTVQPVRYVNEVGQERWQPRLSDGRRLVRTSVAWEPTVVWSHSEELGPVLYRSQSRAKRIGLRQARREWREDNIKTWKEDQ